MIRILVADDHAMVRDGLKQLISLNDDMTVAAEATNGEEAMALLRDSAADDGIDILLLDMNMPGISGKDLIAIIRSHHPGLPILVLSMHIESSIAQSALDAGAQGYLTKDNGIETLLAAIRNIAGGGRYIDPKLVDQVGFATEDSRKS